MFECWTVLSLSSLLSIVVAANTESLSIPLMYSNGLQANTMQQALYKEKMRASHLHSPVSIGLGLSLLNFPIGSSYTPRECFRKLLHLLLFFLV